MKSYKAGDQVFDSYFVAGDKAPTTSEDGGEAGAGAGAASESKQKSFQCEVDTLWEYGFITGWSRRSQLGIVYRYWAWE